MTGQNFTQKVAKRRRYHLASSKLGWIDSIRVDGITIKCGTCNKKIVNKQESILGAQAAALKKGAVILPQYADKTVMGNDADGMCYHHRDCVRKGQTKFVRREDKMFESLLEGYTGA